MRILWDNNILDRVEDLDPGDRAKLASCLHRRRHSLYATVDGLEETLGLLRTTRQDRLIRMMTWYPGMISRFLAPFGLIIQSELRLERKPFAEAWLEKRLRETLDALQR